MLHTDGFCLFCGEKIEGKRDDAKFCSDRHRTEYNLIGPRIEDAARRALIDLSKIDSLVGVHPEFVEQARTVVQTIIESAKGIKPRKPYTKKED